MDLFVDTETGRRADDHDDRRSIGVSTASKMEPMELDAGKDEDFMNESFLREGGRPENGKSSRPSQHALQGPPRCYLNGLIKVQPIGNMHILFPDYFQTSGWGVLGPQWFGPTCVWGLLVLASHFCINKASTLGPGSVVLCYMFFGASTYFLTDVSLRDPGICLQKEIPETVSPSEMSQWRWCDFCQVYQAPGGAHCPDCNVCIAGYDHHCVWMGTCIGKRNFRQFVRFNVSWLYYLGFVLLWLVTFGPLFEGK